MFQHLVMGGIIVHHIGDHGDTGHAFFPVSFIGRNSTEPLYAHKVLIGRIDGRFCRRVYPLAVQDVFSSIPFKHGKISRRRFAGCANADAHKANTSDVAENNIAFVDVAQQSPAFTAGRKPYLRASSQLLPEPYSTVNRRALLFWISISVSSSQPPANSLI